MDEDIAKSTLDLLTTALEVPAGLITELPAAVQRTLRNVLDDGDAAVARAEVEGSIYLAHRATSPSVPILVVGPYSGWSNPDGADRSTAARLDHMEAALRAAAAVMERTAVTVERARFDRCGTTNEYQLQAIIDQLPEAVLLARPDPDRVVLANRQVADLLGWDIRPPLRLDDFAKRNQRFTVAGAPMSGVELPLTRALQQGEIVARHEILLVRPDGAHVRLLVNASPLRDTHGQITAAVAVFQDVSQLTAAEQLRDDFLALASHELRTPLTAIHGSTYLLLHDAERLPVETRRELLTDVVNASRRLGDLVENMSQVTTIRAGEIIIRREPVAVSALIEQAVAAVLRSGPPRPLTVDVTPGLVALGDSQRLDQVMRNLLYNALKYSPEGSPIEVTAEASDEMVVISVRDHGPGFAPELRERVFERFPGGRDSSLTATGGLGLGLYLAKQFVEAQGGHIWIEQPDGEGALLRFTVPQMHESPQS